MRRYVSENGIDSDQCGQTFEAACKTMTPVLEQIHTLNSFVSPDLLDQVEAVWTRVSDQFQSRYVSHFLKLFRFNVNLKD